MSVIDFEQDAAQDQVFDIEGSKALSDQIKKLQDIMKFLQRKKN